MLTRPRFISALLLLSVSAGWAAPAAAHALLLTSDPAANTTVAASSLDITLRYNSRVDVGRSRLTLKKDGGTNQQLAIKGGDSPAILLSQATGLTAGQYLLHWEVLSIDGHISRGDLPFTVTAP